MERLAANAGNQQASWSTLNRQNRLDNTRGLFDASVNPSPRTEERIGRNKEQTLEGINLTNTCERASDPSRLQIIQPYAAPE
eukprot:3983869-Pyramimonas_sp.AAC.1